MPWWIYLIISVIFVVAIAWRAVVYFVLKKLYKPTKRDYEMILAYETAEKGFQKRWLDIPYREMRRTSRYGYELFARYYDCGKDSNKIMLCLHGHNSCSLSQMKYLEMFLELGYNVFMPDHKRSGFSGGDIITFGATEKHDVIDWINVLQSEYPTARFAIFGESMGAATSMMVTSMDKRIEYLIEYCGYADFEGLLSKYVGNATIRKLILPTFESMSRLFFKIDFDEINAGKAMRKINKPIMIIHSKADQTVVYYNAQKLMSARPNATIKIFEDCAHARSMVKYPDEYKKAVTEFVKNAEEKVKM